MTFLAGLIVITVQLILYLYSILH